MRKIVNSTFMSLDGVIDNPGRWSMPWFGKDSGEVIGEIMNGSDALLMGRRTYEGFAEAWPKAEEAGADGAVEMNSMPKYVVTSTLEKAEWTNSTIIPGDEMIARVTELKQQPGANILIYGFGRLSYELLEHGLLDEVHFWVYPVLLGGGPNLGDLLTRDGEKLPLELVKTRALDTGVVVLTYRPAPKES
jgi:dihydrofolate reductase